MGNAEVIATIETRPVAVRFVCPSCGHEQRIDYDEFLGYESELWNGELDVGCSDCGGMASVSGCEWDV